MPRQVALGLIACEVMRLSSINSRGDPACNSKLVETMIRQHEVLMNLKNPKLIKNLQAIHGLVIPEAGIFYSGATVPESSEIALIAGLRTHEPSLEFVQCITLRPQNAAADLSLGPVRPVQRRAPNRFVTVISADPQPRWNERVRLASRA